jgi:hypothetical protein
VTYIAGVFIFIPNNSHKWYWSAALDARTIESLDFASAEMKPDDLLDVRAVQGRLYLFGQESTEPWFPSGNVDLPFTRIDQGLMSTGVVATGCVAELGDTLAFVGHDCSVYRITGGPERISHNGIEERIRNSTTVSCFAFSYDGHAFFCVRLDTMTLAFDMATEEWCEFASYGRTNWRAKCATNVGPVAYFGDDETNNVWKFGNTFRDHDGDLEAYFTALAEIDGGAVIFDNIEVRANVGHTDPLSGDDAEPEIEMRSSRDAGETFGAWRSAPLGAQGKYRNRAIWRRNGSFDPPGAYFEFRLTDRSPRRISTVLFNEAGGGRSR